MCCECAGQCSRRRLPSPPRPRPVAPRLPRAVGWRRFQSLPVYALEDNNGRYRMLKYSPEHMHCLATVWGPLAPPNTGVLAVQKLDSGQASWRIAATGVVLQLDASLRIMKKLKLVGAPFKVSAPHCLLQPRTAARSSRTGGSRRSPSCPIAFLPA